MQYFANWQAALHTWQPLTLSLIGALVYYSAALLFHRFWGLLGVVAFFVLALVGANIMVLKLTVFAQFAQPVALGTALFSTTYFITDLIAEHYGVKTALKTVGVGFASMVLWSFITFHMLAYAPLGAENLNPKQLENFSWALQTHYSMENLFAIVPSITLASMLAFVLSQVSDVYLFGWIRRKTLGRWLFLRNNISTFFSTLLDNALFSYLAFRLFSANPIPWNALLFSYILGTYVLRLFFALLDTPFLYLSQHKFFRPSVKIQGLPEKQENARKNTHYGKRKPQ